MTKNDPQKSEEMYCFEVLDVLSLRDGGFSCTLDVLPRAIGNI
jgi:hypothetical protein